MANMINLEIVSAESEIFTGEAELVMVTGSQGEMGIAAGHTPLITQIKPGTVEIMTIEGEIQDVYYVSGGMLEVQPDVVTVLADTAIRAHDLDEAEAIKAKERAEEMLEERKADIDYAMASAELARAVAQLRALKDLRLIRDALK